MFVNAAYIYTDQLCGLDVAVLSKKSKIDCSQVDLGILACLISIDQSIRMRPDMAAATINSKRSRSVYFFPRGCQRIWMVE